MKKEIGFTTLYVTKELAEKIKKIAKEDKRNIVNTIDFIVDFYINNRDKNRQ